MNLYDLHDDQTKLAHHDRQHEVVPQLAWQRGENTGKWNEAALAKDTKLAFRYAREILKGRFKLGEPAIAKDNLFS